MYFRIINSISNDIKEWLFYQPNVKEESITDRLLYDLSRKVPGVYYRDFSRFEEGRITGADWEWWIVFRDGSFRFRVQAKKEYTDNYPSLMYTNTHGLQIEMLINDSKRINAIPLYAFFTANTSPTLCPKSPTNEGVFLSSAEDLYIEYAKKARSKIIISDILKRSNPLTCFFCCPSYYKTAAGFRTYLTSYFSAAYGKKVYFNDTLEEYAGFNYGYYENNPSYIEELMSNEPLPEWFENEYNNHLKEIKRILIVDMRNYDNEI